MNLKKMSKKFQKFSSKNMPYNWMRKFSHADQRLKQNYKEENLTSLYQEKFLLGREFGQMLNQGNILSPIMLVKRVYKQRPQDMSTTTCTTQPQGLALCSRYHPAWASEAPQWVPARTPTVHWGRYNGRPWVARHQRHKCEVKMQRRIIQELQNTCPQTNMVAERVNTNRRWRSTSRFRRLSRYRRNWSRWRPCERRIRTRRLTSWTQLRPSAQIQRHVKKMIKETDVDKAQWNSLLEFGNEMCWPKRDDCGVPQERLQERPSTSWFLKWRRKHSMACRSCHRSACRIAKWSNSLTCQFQRVKRTFLKWSSQASREVVPNIPTVWTLKRVVEQIVDIRKTQVTEKTEKIPKITQQVENTHYQLQNVSW